MISAVVFQMLPLASFGQPKFDFDANITQPQILAYVRDTYTQLKIAIDGSYPNAIIPTLFKNMTKCADLYSKIRAGI